MHKTLYVVDHWHSLFKWWETRDKQMKRTVVRRCKYNIHKNEWNKDSCICAIPYMFSSVHDELHIKTAHIVYSTEIFDDAFQYAKMQLCMKEIT